MQRVNKRSLWKRTKSRKKLSKLKERNSPFLIVNCREQQTNFIEIIPEEFFRDNVKKSYRHQQWHRTNFNNFYVRLFWFLINKLNFLDIIFSHKSFWYLLNYLLSCKLWKYIPSHLSKFLNKQIDNKSFTEVFFCNLKEISSFVAPIHPKVDICRIVLKSEEVVLN